MTTMVISPDHPLQLCRVPSTERAGVRPRAATTTGLRLTRRGRGVVVAMALVAAAAFASVAQHASAGAPAAPVPVTTWTVAPGETLWQIAGTVAEPGEDRRVVVAELIELNGLPGAGIQAGQQILVPRS